MRKLTVFLLAAYSFLAVTELSAQKLRADQVMGLGVTSANLSGIALRVTDSSSTTADYTVRLRQFGIVYGARVDVFAWNKGSFSIGSPVMLGISTSGKYRSVNVTGALSDTVQGVKGTHIMFEIPVFADLNIGLHSAADESRNHSLGIYLGAGYQYSYTLLQTYLGKRIQDGFDPVFHAGLRMGSAWENRFSIAFTLRGGFDKQSTRTYGLQLLKEL